MANVYGRVNKISNVLGRSEYISSNKRQEKIVLHKQNLLHDWSEHAAFEKAHQKSNMANNQALEVHFALPNELSEDKIKLESVCDDVAKAIVGENKDYEYAVHWNKSYTNLHVHILFSERENQLEIEPKIYKRDIYYNFEEKKLSKKSDPKAEIIHHKGDIQYDQDGNIKYQTDIFKAKDTRFISKTFVHDKNRIFESVIKSYGFNLEYQDKNSPYLSQKKLYKGASEDYLEKAKAWNAEVKRYNESVKQHLEIEPEVLNEYRSVKNEIMENIKEANSKIKQITERAIEIIQDAADWVQKQLEDALNVIYDIIGDIDVQKLKKDEKVVREALNDFYKHDLLDEDEYYILSQKEQIYEVVNLIEDDDARGYTDTQWSILFEEALDRSREKELAR